MSGFLYFRPGNASQVSLDEACELGLAHAFDKKPTTREAMSGPSGTAGAVFADPRRLGDQPIGYYPDKQEWHAVPVAEGKPRLYIGWYTSSVPGPTDLAREKQLPGPELELGDGQAWQVPLLREWDTLDAQGYCVLPSRMIRTADAKWIRGEVLAAYQSIWDQANKYWESVMGVLATSEETDADSNADSRTVEFAFDHIVEFACELLGLNYMIGPLEVSALGLLIDDGMTTQITNAAVDLPTFIEWVAKKNEEADAGVNTSAGDDN